MKKLSDEEIKQRVLEVADYTIETGSSTRKTASYFTENRFPISNCTVSKYLTERLVKIDLERYKLVKQVIGHNTPKDVTSIEVQKRIYRAVTLLLQGLTISQIAEEMGETFDIIYDDLTRRVLLIEKNPEVLFQIKEQLSLNRLSTLNNQNGNGPNMSAKSQPRKEDGTFTSYHQK